MTTKNETINPELVALVKRVREALEHEAFNAAENGYEDVASGLRTLAASLEGMVLVRMEDVQNELSALLSRERTAWTSGYEAGVKAAAEKAATLVRTTNLEDVLGGDDAVLTEASNTIKRYFEVE